MIVWNEDISRYNGTSPGSVRVYVVAEDEDDRRKLAAAAPAPAPEDDENAPPEEDENAEVAPESVWRKHTVL